MLNKEGQRYNVGSTWERGIRMLTKIMQHKTESAVIFFAFILPFITMVVIGALSIYLSYSG